MWKDLEVSSKDSNIKWKLVVSHRPLYCSNQETGDCVTNFWYLRPFEALFQKYKVDFLLWSHEHFYETLSFMKDFKM